MSDTYVSQAFRETNAYTPHDGGFDPFIGTPVQTHRLKAYCKVFVDGLDVTAKVDPHLISVRVRDGSPNIGELELDDRDGTLPIPPNRSNLEVWLGWQSEALVKVFNGFITDLEHGFGRKQGGRRMWIQASWDQFGQLKAPQQLTMGAGAPVGQTKGAENSAQDWLNLMFKGSGTAMKVHPAFAQVKRDFWQQTGSPIHEAEGLAKEFGARFRVQANGEAVFTMPGFNPDGSATDAIIARWGDNLIAWKVRPWISRGAWGGARQQWFDHVSANWKQVLTDIKSPGPWGTATAKYLMPAPAGNGQVASQQNTGVADGAPYNGTGRIAINGEPLARYQGHVYLEGARPGVDGLWLIECAEHVYSRQGYITWLDVRAVARADLPVKMTGLPPGAKSIVDAYTPQPETAQNSASGWLNIPSFDQPTGDASFDQPKGQVDIGPITIVE